VRDFRAILPRFGGDNLTRNLDLVEGLRAFAVSRGATVAQVAIAWVLSRGPFIVPLVGARRPDQLSESLAACDLAPTPGDLAAIETALPADRVAGARYHAAGMRGLDSESGDTPAGG
jgi:aryl-alcohol dehydrogenase-like predicted oxidoreductase